ETVGNVAGRTQERSTFHGKAILPCFKAGSTTLTGSASCTSDKFNCSISLRSTSGQLSLKTASGTLRKVSGPAAAAGAACGTAARPFPFPFPLVAAEGKRGVATGKGVAPTPRADGNAG